MGDDGLLLRAFVRFLDSDAAQYGANFFAANWKAYQATPPPKDPYANFPKFRPCAKCGSAHRYFPTVEPCPIDLGYVAPL